MQRDRTRWFASLLDYRVVGVSEWSAAVARRAASIDAGRVQSIYNWIDTTAFRPRDTAALRQELGLTGRFVLLATATHWDERKGLPALLALARRLPADCVLIVIGRIAHDVRLPERVVHVPHLEDVDTLASYYAMADVFVTLSSAETFGKVTAEALCCGTPAVVYDLAASPELIGPGCGYAVPYAEGVDGVERRVLEVRANGKAAYEAACTAFARRMFDMETNAAAYLDCYQALLQTKGNA